MQDIFSGAIDGSDLFTPGGVDVGHIASNGSETTLADAFGEPGIIAESTNGIDTFLDGQGHDIGFVDPNGQFSFQDGTLGHVEHDSLGNTHIIDDLNHENDLSLESGPLGVSINDADALPLLIAKRSFGV